MAGRAEKEPGLWVFAPEGAAEPGGAPGLQLCPMHAPSTAEPGCQGEEKAIWGLFYCTQQKARKEVKEREGMVVAVLCPHILTSPLPPCQSQGTQEPPGDPAPQTRAGTPHRGGQQAAAGLQAEVRQAGGSPGGCSAHLRSREDAALLVPAVPPRQAAGRIVSQLHQL